MIRRVVLAETEQGQPVAIGPVVRDEAVERLHDEIEERGWTNTGTVHYLSAAQFRDGSR